MASSEDTLETITGKINAFWKKHDNYRASLAVLVCQAKQMVEKGEDPYIKGRSWRTYASEEFGGRHPGEIRKLLRMGKSSDPSAEHEREKAAARAGMARVRAKRANVSALARTGNVTTDIAIDAGTSATPPAREPAPITLATVKQAAFLLGGEDRTRLAYWLIPLLSADDRAALLECVWERETAPEPAAA